MGVLISGSVELLIEAIRCPDAGLRRQLVQATVDTSQRRLSPSLQRITSEVIEEVRRCHSEWLRQTPDQSPAIEAASRAKALWQSLGRDPSVIPSGMSMNAAFLKETLQTGKEGQKSRRKVLREGSQPDLIAMLEEARAELGPIVERMPPGERHWRVMAGAVLWVALLGGPVLADIRTWLSGGLRVHEELDRVEWMRFWCTEVRPAAIPSYLLYLLAELHQTDAGIEVHTSNAFDIIHATYLLDVDALLTGDANFVKVLEAMRTDVPFTFANAILFDKTQSDGAAAFRSALGACRAT
jgi:hypothetical protein